MKNKLVSLTDMIKLCDNEELSQTYIRYLCGLDNEHQYHHQEIKDIKIFLDVFRLSGNKHYGGFLYSYAVPQLNKEFDLLKITNDYCINIELKSQEISHEKMLRQLLQNQHYLKIIGKVQLFCFAFVSETKTLYTINESGELVGSSISNLNDILENCGAGESIDLDEIFIPKNILVSPLNSANKFLRGDYLLTENQENIKKAAINYITNNSDERFAGITGGPGTGKTLLIYDIAKELSKTNRILMVHSGILCNGHYELNRQLHNIKIISAKELRLREIKDVDIVIVDEAHRLYTDSLDKIERWVKRAKTICLFSYDAGQTLSASEKRRRTAETIDRICKKNLYKLTNKIRTNKELALFITCLKDLSKYREEYSFPNVKVIYEPNLRKAVERARTFETEGYTYISFTASFFNHELDYQKSEYNTHNVIGQEFEGVCMILDNNWQYIENKLVGSTHPNPDYLFEQLLYQGLTRVRSKIALIVCREKVLARIMPLLKNS